MERMTSKVLATILIATLALSMVVFEAPIASATITGRPTVYVGNVTGDPLNVTAGTEINIYIGNMTITGAQVWLWLSPYGGSEINTALGDRWYAGPFYMGDVMGTTIKTYEFTPPEPFAEEGRKYVFTVGNGWINGTVPLLVVGGVDYWIKISDIAPRDVIPSTEVGVSTNRIRFTPGYSVSPTTVAPNTVITVSGYAVPVPEYYNISQSGILFNSTPRMLWSALLVPSRLISKPDPWGLWNYTAFTATFPAMDLMLRRPNATGTITVSIVQNSTSTTVHSAPLNQPPRVVQLPSPEDRNDYGEDYSTGALVLTLRTGGRYNVTMNWFPSGGTFNILLNTTPVASGSLNATGGVYNFTITIPDLRSGRYLFRVVDNLGVEYSFWVNVSMAPYILVDPTEGHVGDSFTVIGRNFLDYIGQYVTIHFKNSEVSPYYVLLANFTVTDTHWTVTLVVPRSAGGDRLVEVRDVTGTTTITFTTFKVLPKLEVVPPVIKNDGSPVRVVGTGFRPGVWYATNVDNQFLAANIGTGGYLAGVQANATGDLQICFVAAGFRPGVHVISLYPNATGPSYEPAHYALFTVTVEGDPIVEFLKSINATVVDIRDGVATIKTDLGTVTTTLDAINAKLVSIEDGIATISTAVGEVKADLSALKPVVTEIKDDVATIKTAVGEIKGKVVAIDGNVVTIRTDVGEIKATVADVKGAASAIKSIVDAVQYSVWVAAIFAIIAAIAAIYAVVSIRRKIAK